MLTWVIVLIAVVVVVGALLALMRVSSSRAGRRTAALKDRFGPEYDRLVAERSQRSAEHELIDRERRHETLDIKPLAEADRTAFAQQWEQAQLSFLDDPAQAVKTAESLVQQVMSLRGYPAQADLAAQANELSVEHARQLSNLRAAQEISVAASAGRATTEDLRQAMVRYRALFADLLRAGADELVAYPDDAGERIKIIRD